MASIGTVMGKRAALIWFPRTDFAYYRRLGVAGSAATVIGGLLARAGSGRHVPHVLPGIALRTSNASAVFVMYVGLATLLLAWWRIGLLIRGPEAPPRGALALTAAWWGAPFAVIPPIFSDDVYSYLAQGAMTMRGLDAYRMGPAALGGPLAAHVPDVWQHTPAPYGPVFLDLAGVVTELTGRQVWAGIIGMRVLAVIAVAVLMWAVPRLASHCGVSPAAAVWLGVLNPLVLLHLIGDAHNDGLMLALMCLGLVWAVQRRPLLGTITLVLAVLVKAPAALTLAFAVPIWASQLDGPRPRVRAGLRVVGVAAGTATVVTLMTGTGFGWLRTLGTPTRARTWMSITTDLGYLTGTLTRRLAGFSMDQTRHAFWLAGLVVAGAVSVVLWLRTDRTGPIAGLGLSLAVVVLAGPVVHPWYLLWSVVPLAATAGEAMRRTLMLGTVALVLLVIPTGLQPGLSVLTAALLGVSSVLAIALACREVGRDRPLEPLVVGRPSPRLPWPRRAPVPAASQVGPIRRCGARNDAR